MTGSKILEKMDFIEQEFYKLAHSTYKLAHRNAAFNLWEISNSEPTSGMVKIEPNGRRVELHTAPITITHTRLVDRHVTFVSTRPAAPAGMDKDLPSTK